MMPLPTQQKGPAMTLHLLAPVPLLFALTACATSGSLQPAGGGWGDAPAVTEANYNLGDPAVFALTGAENLTEAAMAIQSRLASTEPAEGNYSEDLNVFSGEIIGMPRGAVVFTADNLPDDSVRTEQHVIEFDVSAETEAVTPTAYGTRHKCQRGDNVGEWTTALCP